MNLFPRLVVMFLLVLATSLASGELLDPYATGSDSPAIPLATGPGTPLSAPKPKLLVFCPFPSAPHPFCEAYAGLDFFDVRVSYIPRATFQSLPDLRNFIAGVLRLHATSPQLQMLWASHGMKSMGGVYEVPYGDEEAGGDNIQAGLSIVQAFSDAHLLAGLIDAVPLHMDTCFADLAGPTLPLSSACPLCGTITVSRFPGIAAVVTSSKISEVRNGHYSMLLKQVRNDFCRQASGGAASLTVGQFDTFLRSADGALLLRSLGWYGGTANGPQVLIPSGGSVNTRLFDCPTGFPVNIEQVSIVTRGSASTPSVLGALTLNGDAENGPKTCLVQLDASNGASVRLSDCSALTNRLLSASASGLNVALGSDARITATSWTCTGQGGAVRIFGGETFSGVFQGAATCSYEIVIDDVAPQTHVVKVATLGGSKLTAAQMRIRGNSTTPATDIDCGTQCRQDVTTGATVNLRVGPNAPAAITFLSSPFNGFLWTHPVTDSTRSCCQRPWPDVVSALGSMPPFRSDCLLSAIDADRSCSVAAVTHVPLSIEYVDEKGNAMQGAAVVALGLDGRYVSGTQYLGAKQIWGYADPGQVLVAPVDVKGYTVVKTEVLGGGAVLPPASWLKTPAEMRGELALAKAQVPGVANVVSGGERPDLGAFGKVPAGSGITIRVQYKAVPVPMLKQEEIEIGD